MGETSVPSIVVDADDNKALDLALLENEVRSDLTYMEKAEAIEEYKKATTRHTKKLQKLSA